MKVRVINGPNLNMLGVREPEIYGHQTYQDLVDYIEKEAKALEIEVECFQSNYEGDLVTWVQQSLGRADAIIINPAAYTHTSVAILDALKAVALPAVEVHLSDVTARDHFRKHSYTAEGCQAVIAGRGFQGYKDAMLFLKKK